MQKQGLEFSFSGLKTAVIQTIRHLADSGQEIPVADICASFQACVTDILVTKAFRAADQYKVSTVMLCGGVAANRFISNRFQEEADRLGKTLLVLPPILCTDNAAMIGAAAYYQAQHVSKGIPLEAKSNLGIGEPSCN